MVDKIWYNMEELVGGSEERILIETYWNVKTLEIEKIAPCNPILIETYWNVKFYVSRETLRQAHILIETYWNVKGLDCTGTGSKKDINRNILECKVRITGGVTQTSYILIETYWNVKSKLKF